MCWVSWHSKHVICFKITRNKFSSLKTLPWQQYYRYQYSLHSFTSAVFWTYSDEVWSKSIKNKMLNSSILKNDTLLLPVGGAILWLLIVTSMRSASYNRTKPWSLIQNQTMYVDVIRRFLSLIFHHKFIAYATGKPVRDIKISWQFCVPNVLRSCSPSLVAIGW